MQFKSHARGWQNLEKNQKPDDDNPFFKQADLGDYKFWPTIFGSIGEYKKQVIIASVCAVISGFAVAMQNISVKFIVDEGIVRKDADIKERVTWALVFVGFYIAMSSTRIIAWLIGYRRMVQALEGFLFRIRSRLFRHVQRLCFRFHDSVSSGELFNYIMGSPLNYLKMFLQQFVMVAPNQAVSWIVALATLIYFDWLMSLILIATVICIVFVNRRSRLIIRDMAADFMREESSVSKYVADMLRGSREVKIHAIEGDVSDRFDMQIGRIREQSEMLSKRQNLEHVKPEGLHYIGMAMIFIAGTLSCIYRGMTVGELFAFINSVNLLMGPLMMLFRLNLVKANAEAGLERIMRILKTESTVEEKPQQVQLKVDEQEKVAREECAPFVEFRNVEFAYTTYPVLRNISCTINFGENVALAGPSGSGKSTFANLVLRLYEVQKGQILIEGRDIRRFSLTDLRSHFGVVTQDPFLFQTTIYENVRVASPHASRQEVERAMELAYVNEFLALMPKGAETQVGENGYSLSGGQKQRIAIARAILGKHPFYIFDEATSALDNTSEKRIQQAMRELMKEHTIIVIAHRLSTIRHVDKILVFERGNIVQQGNFEQLSAEEGLFQELLQHGY
ncbi:MAG: ATP-binding cassette domain-containing protein [Chitinivibrionales bacterium]|nr:ATP-binding cassette domain-containing protein [Chitinivibrionales bacterium]